MELDNEPASKKRKPVPGYVRFPIAGLSGMGATLIVHPLDLVRFRMQLSGEGGAAADHRSWIHAFRSVFRQEGIYGIYTGMSANLLHQAIYTTTRMGSFQTMRDKFKEMGHDSLPYEVIAAMTGGFVAGSLATPAEVALVRMTANGKLTPPERRNYRHVFNALRRISAEEGTKGLFTGIKPTILRAMIANVAQLVSYTQTKEFLINNQYMENNMKCHFLSSLVAGYAFAFATCPIDVLKTRIQFMESTTGTPLYTGILDAMKKTVHKEGVTALWKGFSPLYARCAPHTSLLFVFSEELTYLYRKYCVNAPGLDY